jgi:hypothetical protein
MEQVVIGGPQCPGCKKRPFVHDVTVNQFPNGMVIGINYCHDCGHIVDTFLLGVEQPKIVPTGPRLVL